MVEETILVTVKTYPNISSKYVETVCTAGINERGEWRRLYPIRFRHLEGEKQFKLYDRIKVRLEEHSSDGRIESRRPRTDTIQVLGRLTQWNLRYEWVQGTIVDSLKELEERGGSIGPVRVSRVMEWYWKDSPRDWTPKQLEILKQQPLFDDEMPKALEKVPYEFRIRWLDGRGHEHDNLFMAWEVFETWRKYRFRYTQPLQVMKDKWMNDILSDDRLLCFFMGNIAQRRNRFMVCGIYNPPKREIDKNESLF